MENVLEPEAAPPERFTLQDYFTPVRHRRLRRFPHLLRTAVRIVWSAARRQLLALAALQLAVGAGLAIQLLAIRGLLSDLLAPGGADSFSAVLPEVIVVAVLGAVVATATVVIDAQQRVLGQLVALHASDEVIRTAASVDLITFDSPDFHDRLQRAQLSASQRPAQMVSGLLAVGGALFAIGGIVVALLVIEPLFCGLVIVAYLPAWIATNRAARLVYRFSVEQTERERRRMYLFELLTSKREAQEVRAFDLGGHLGDRHRRIYERLIRELREVLRRRLRVALAGQLLTAALTAGALCVLVWFVIRDWMSLSQAGAAAGAMVLLTGRLRALSTGAGGLYESSLYLEDYATFVAARPRIEATRPSAAAPSDPQVLTADAVSFTYPSRTRPSLVGASLTLRRGEVVALVGENGSGKTTLAKLLGALFTPTLGRVLWGDADLRTLDRRALRRQIGIIFQDFVRYQLTARENIGYGRAEAVDDTAAVAAAAEQAGAHAFLERLPDSYETVLGKEFTGGYDLSIGQWQRIALARAFFREARLLVLDEPTASLDARSEHELFEYVQALARGRSVLLISHRFSTVKSADRIYVLHHGEIVEEGSHTELVAQGGRYAELFELQAAAYR